MENQRGKNPRTDTRQAAHASPAPAAGERRKGGRSDDGDAFMPDPGDGPAFVDDDLAESLAEDFVRSATSGEDVDDELMDQVVPEELGGPFVETTGSEEFAGGTDESNPEDATAEPLPRAMRGLADRPPE